MSYGYLNGKEKPGGVFGEISGNVVYGSQSINGQARGWGFELGNLRPTANGGGTVVKNNIFSGYNGVGTGVLWPAIHVTFGSNTVNPTEAVGVNDLTIQNNIISGWTKGLYINPGFAVGGNTRYALNNLSVLNNEFQTIYASPMIEHGPNYSSAEETWRGNRYNYSNNAASSTPFFATKATTYSLTQWQGLAEPTATNAKITYPNANVSPASFNGSIGGTSSTDAYLTQSRRQSSLFYRPNYSPTAAVNYMKAGFSGQRTDTQRPLPASTARTSMPAVPRPIRLRSMDR